MPEFAPSHLPGFPVHPGLFLREEIEARGLSVEELAEQTNRTLAELLAVVQEGALIDQSLADDLARALDTSSEGWVNGTTLYLMTLERDYLRDSAAESVAAVD